jgi:N-acetylneuraminate synthase|tara:strand:+ start:583 stop:1407 length:825 start_codon:yes stop_codon:yes gene_type:complete
MINVIGEIGINHNGSVEIAKNLIDVCSIAGCSHVKFQKRTPEICVPDHQKDVIRTTPWGELTYLEYKKKIEFGYEEYLELFNYANEKQIGFLASVWDKPSVDFMSNFGGTMKIPSALITDNELVRYARERSDYLMVSTGMSNEEEVENVISVGSPDLVFHTNSTYPSPIEELNLNYINWLKEKYPHVEIGYSGHEYGLVTTFAAVAMGATWVERHVTLDRTMFGSDQMASVEPIGLMKLMKGIRDIELSLGHGGPRTRTTGELSKMNSLRKAVS